MPFSVRTPPDIEEKIIRRYREGELTLRAVAAKCGVATGTVSNVLRRAGVKIENRSRSRNWHKYTAEIVRLYVDEDRPVKQVARILKLKPAVVSQALRSANVEIKGGRQRSIVFPEIRKLKVGESLDLPNVSGVKRYKYTRYYIMAKKAGIRVSVSVISADKVRVTRKA